MMSYWPTYVSSVALAIVISGCVLHLSANVDRHSPGCERWGFILTGAGAFGKVVYLWWPKIESFPFPTLMHVGMALIALALLRGHLRGWLSRLNGFHWAERRQHEINS